MLSGNEAAVTEHELAVVVDPSPVVMILLNCLEAAYGIPLIHLCLLLHPATVPRPGPMGCPKLGQLSVVDITSIASSDSTHREASDVDPFHCDRAKFHGAIARS